MATIVKPYTFSAGATIVAAEHNDNFDTIYNDYNGNITNANIASGASIVDTKLAQITTANKISGAAITLLTSLPSGAGLVPITNIATVTGTGTINCVLTASKGPGAVTSTAVNGWIMFVIGSDNNYIPYWK